jgi:hypothetical protein
LEARMDDIIYITLGAALFVLMGAYGFGLRRL